MIKLAHLLLQTKLDANILVFHKQPAVNHLYMARLLYIWIWDILIKRVNIVMLSFGMRNDSKVIVLMEGLNIAGVVMVVGSGYHLANVGDSVNNSSGPYAFKVEGQISHWMGSLCPPPGQTLRFLQMYIYEGNEGVPKSSKSLNWLIFFFHATWLAIHG
nr:putative helitron helicase-like domain-containing protein [Tanacetum cinerariifolium]